jgi:hypothetical protein
MIVGFITWVKEQITIYAQIFNKQVFGQNSLNLRVISDCLRSTTEQCSLVSTSYHFGINLYILITNVPGLVA